MREVLKSLVEVPFQLVLEIFTDTVAKYPVESLKIFLVILLLYLCSKFETCCGCLLIFIFLAWIIF